MRRASKGCLIWALVLVLVSFVVAVIVTRYLAREAVRTYEVEQKRYIWPPPERQGSPTQ